MAEPSPTDMDKDQLFVTLKRIYDRLEESERKNARLQEQIGKMCEEIAQLKDKRLQTMVEELRNVRPATINPANSQWRSLLEAIQHNDLAGVRGYLSRTNAAKFDERIGGYTPLERAAANGFLEIVAEILKMEPFTGNVRQRAIHLASENEHFEIVKILVEAGVNANYLDNDGETPLMGASRSGAEDIVRFLLEKGADATSKTKANHTSLHGASVSGSLATVQMLLGHGADVNIADDKGNTLLHLAWISRDTHKETADAVIRCLLENGANPNIQNLNNMCPLFWAVEKSVDPITRLIVEKSPDLNFDVPTGPYSQEQALVIAIRRDQLEMVRLLLEHGADPDVQLEKNGFGTVLAWAKDNTENKAILRLLANHGQD